MFGDEIMLYDFLLINKSSQINEEKLKFRVDIEKFDKYLITEEHWKIFFHYSFDSNELRKCFAGLSESEKLKVLKFGIACLLAFIQCNFSGPNLSKEVEDIINQDVYKKNNFDKLLSIDSEDINVNTKYSILLVTAKLVFKFCHVTNIVNSWWHWRSIIIHQEILEELSPTLLSEADQLFNSFTEDLNLCGSTKAALDIEIAQLYLIFRHISKAEKHLSSALDLLGVHYNLIGVLGKRTKYQQNDLAQLSLKVTLDNEIIEQLEVDDSNIPQDIPIDDDIRLDAIKLSEKPNEKIELGFLEQNLFINLIKEMLISKPQDDLQVEEIMPFLTLILKQKNTFAIRTVTLLLRSKLEGKNRRTIERSLRQCEKIVHILQRDELSIPNRLNNFFGTGMPPMWKVQTQLADLLLNMGLVKAALDIYLKIQRWEEVIVCYTILNLRHKAAEIIQEQLNIKPTVKLWCLLGDATDDISCYEKAWKLSNQRSHKAQRHWGQFFYSRKQYDECIQHFEKSLNINPLQANIWFRLGYAALQTENWQLAATAYRRYTTIEPESFEAWNNLAQAYIKMGNKRNAHQAILEAIKCNFENWKVWENLLVVSCDISNFTDVIRSYHRLLDLKKEYINVNVLNVLVYNICSNTNDCEGQSSQRFLGKTKELLGRITSISPSEGNIWELYANLDSEPIPRIQKLIRAYKCYTHKDWDKNPMTCQEVLNVCIKLAEIFLNDKRIDSKNTLIHSVRLNLSSAVTAVKKQNWTETTDLVEEVRSLLEKIIEKVKSNTGVS